MLSQSQKLDQVHLQRLVELAEILSRHKNFSEILRLVALRVAQLLNAEIALIMMLNPRTQATVKTIIKEGRELGHLGYRSVQNNVSGWILKEKNDNSFDLLDFEIYIILSFLFILSKFLRHSNY